MGLYLTLGTYWRTEMDARLSVVVALVIAGVFPAMALYAWQAQAGVYTEEGAAQVAIHFLRNGPTFRFDGIPESIDVIETRILESHPVQYVITIEFECRHAGYGDRTGQILAQVITPHEMAVTVVEGSSPEIWPSSTSSRATPSWGRSPSRRRGPSRT